MSFVSGGAKEGWLVVVVVVVLIQAEIDNQPNVYYYYTSPRLPSKRLKFY